MPILNTGNWYEPLTPVMALVLLIITISVEVPFILCFAIEGEKWTLKPTKLILSIIGANILSFVFGYVLLQLWKVI